jgi:hypothetical protein
VRKHEGKGSIGSPVFGWEAGIKILHNVLIGHELDSFGSGQGQWRDFAETLINHQVP